MNRALAEKIPTVYLPASSPVPVINTTFRVTSTVSAEIQECTNLTSQIETILAATPVALRDVNPLLKYLSAAWHRLAQRLTIVEPAISSTQDQASVFRTNMASETDAEVIEGHVIYDAYFGVCRLHPMSPVLFVRQIGATITATLDELRKSGLSIDQVEDIVAAASVMLTAMAPRADAIMPLRSASETQGSSADEDILALSPIQTSFYRWKTGHHVFALFSIFCRYFLESGFDGADNPVLELDALCKSIEAAAVILRGTTAAMWFAADFPRQIYEENVRPSMVSEQTPQGFSGTQNFDYERLKEAKARLHRELVSKFGERMRDWPQELGEAYLNFKETELSDLENHVLIAAKMVGRGPSIFAYKGRDERLPPPLAAVDMLREMVAERFEQLRTLLD